MKILVIPTTDWVHNKNSNRLNFICDILSENHDVFVMHFKMPAFENNKPRDTKCKMFDCTKYYIGDPSMYYILNSLYHFKKMREVVKCEKIDIILSANILPSFFANFIGIPVVYDYLDHYLESASVYYSDRKIFSKFVGFGTDILTRYNLRHASQIITVTEELRNYLFNKVGIISYVIPNGVDTSLIYRNTTQYPSVVGSGSNKNTIGYVGSLEDWVDLETPIRAMKKIDNTLLVIVGDAIFTDYGNKIQKLVNDIGVQDRVKFTGFIPYNELKLYISQFDIGLNPLKPMLKNDYAFGGKILNYLACGVPILSTPSKSLENIFEKYDVVPIWYYQNEEQFIQKVNMLIGSNYNTNYRNELREIALKYDWKSLAIQYSGVIENAIDK